MRKSHSFLRVGGGEGIGSVVSNSIVVFMLSRERMRRANGPLTNKLSVVRMGGIGGTCIQKHQRVV
jgi:hypothetical protein